MTKNQAQENSLAICKFARYNIKFARFWRICDSQTGLITSISRIHWPRELRLQFPCRNLLPCYYSVCVPAVSLSSRHLVGCGQTTAVLELPFRPGHSECDHIGRNELLWLVEIWYFQKWTRPQSPTRWSTATLIGQEDWSGDWFGQSLYTNHNDLGSPRSGRPFHKTHVLTRANHSGGSLSHFPNACM